MLPVTKSEPVTPSVAASMAYVPGGTTSSESQKAISSPRAYDAPSLRAAPRPALAVCTARTRPSRAAYWSAILPLSSVEPSSTTITSRSTPSWPSTLSRAAGR